MTTRLEQTDFPNKKRADRNNSIYSLFIFIKASPF